MELAGLEPATSWVRCGALGKVGFLVFSLGKPNPTLSGPGPGSADRRGLPGIAVDSGTSAQRFAEWYGGCGYRTSMDPANPTPEELRETAASEGLMATEEETDPEFEDDRDPTDVPAPEMG